MKSESAKLIRVNAYDHVASALISLLLLLGFAVGVMFLVWLTKVIQFTNRPVPVRPIELEGGRGEHAQGEAREMEEPGVEELAEVQQPQLAQTLEALTEAVSSQAAAFDAFEGSADVMGSGRGRGDSRQAGEGGEGEGVGAIPRWKRWEVRFTTKGLKQYAVQLDFFGIELGAVGGETQVDYLSRLATTPARRAGSPDVEKRLYFTFTGKAQLNEWDKQLLEKAGVKTVGRQLLQFYPPQIEQQLALLESQRAAGRPIAEIKKTIFGVREGGAGFEFFVQDQQYLGGR